MDELENWPANINVVLPLTDEAKTRKLVELQLILIIHVQKCIVREMQDMDKTWFCNRHHCESMRKLWKHMIFCRDRLSCAMPYCVFSKQIIRHWKYCKREDCPVNLSLEQDFNTGDAMLKKLRELASPAMLQVPCDSEIAEWTAVSIVEGVRERCLRITSDFRKKYVEELIEDITSKKYFHTLTDEHLCDLVDFAKKAEGIMFEKARTREQYYQLTTEMKHRIPKEIEKQQEQQLTRQEAQQRSSEQQLAAQPDPKKVVAGSKYLFSIANICFRLLSFDSTAVPTTTGSTFTATVASESIRRPIDVQQLLEMINSSVSGDSGDKALLQSSADPQSEQISPQPIEEVKDWHESVTPELREHIIKKLISSIYAKPLERGIMLEPRLKSLEPWAAKVEARYFQMANSINEYYHMIACQIYGIERSREEKKRLQAQQQAAVQQVPEQQQQVA